MEWSLASVSGLELDVEQVMRRGLPAALKEARVIGRLRSANLGAGPDAATADRVREALRRATDMLYPEYRRDAARALLDLDKRHPASFTRRVDELVSIYAKAAAEGPIRPSRRHRQVLLRAEVPDLRSAIVQALLDLERDFAQAQRSEGRRHVLSRQVQAVSWEQYDGLANELAKKLRPLRSPVDPADSAADNWAVIGISRGGLPLAVHLSHLLSCRAFGVVALWKYRRGDENASVIDGLYTPPRDDNGNPQTLLLVDDVVASGDGLALVARLLRRRYGNPPVRIIEASLLRDPRRAPLTPDSFTAEEYDSSRYWWSLPWEGEAPKHVGPPP